MLECHCLLLFGCWNVIICYCLDVGRAANEYGICLAMEVLHAGRVYIHSGDMLEMSTRGREDRWEHGLLGGINGEF